MKTCWENIEKVATVSPSPRLGRLESMKSSEILEGGNLTPKYVYIIFFHVSFILKETPFFSIFPEGLQHPLPSTEPQGGQISLKFYKQL